MQLSHVPLTGEVPFTSSATSSFFTSFFALSPAFVEKANVLCLGAAAGLAPLGWLKNLL